MSAKFLHLCTVALFSVFGELARFGLSLSTGGLSGVPFRDFAANIVGCFLIGLLVSTRTSMLQSNRLFKRVEAREALIVGLATGFCGCLTTLSGWSQSASDAILNGDMSLWFVIWLVGLSTCIVAFQGGQHVGNVFTTHSEAELSIQVPTVTKASLLMLPLALMVFVAVLFVALVALVGDGAANVLLAALVAPFGGCARCVVIWLNTKCVRFPYSTLTVNVCGTALFAVFVGVFRRQFGPLALFQVEVGGQWENISFALLPVAGIGFCGSFTTVSTFVGELLNIKSLKTSYTYGIVSIVACQLVGTSINAVFRFT